MQHVLDAGELERHEDAIARLPSELNMPSHDLFWSDDDLVAGVYRRRGEQIAQIQRIDAPLLAGET